MNAKIGSIVLSLMALNGAGHAAMPIQDDFIAAGPGTRVNGRDARAGGVTWRASSNLRAGTADKPGASVANAYSYVACVPVPAEGDVIKVSAVCNIKTAAPQGWVGIGLGNPDVANAETQWKSGLFLLLDAEGKYQSFVEFGPDKLYLASDKVDGFDCATSHVLRLAYDRRSRKLDFWVDDAHVVEAYDLAAKGRTPDVSFAGFSGYKPAPDAVVVESFSLTAHEALPEAPGVDPRGISTPKAAPATVLGAKPGVAAAQVGDVVFAEDFRQAPLEELGKGWVPEGGGTWGVEVGAEGLVFNVLPGAHANDLKIQHGLEADAIRGATVRLSARVRGEDVSTRIKPWNGVKVAMRIETPSQTSYPQVRPAPEGTFGWQDVSTVVTIPANVKRLDVCVGLEAVFGRLWIESVSIQVLDVAPVAVAAPAATGAPYKGHSLPRLRGAMVRTSTTEDDLRVLGQEWNANVIRWQFGGLQYKKTGLGTPNLDAIMDAEVARLDNLLPACRKFGLHVVVDLHSPGMKTFESKANQDKLVEIWKKLAAHYKGNPVIWGYDIVNEPRLDEWKEGALLWNDLAERVCREIRKIDPDTAIIIEPEKMGLPEGFSALRPVSVSNVVYSVHMYNPGQFTHNRVYDKSQKPLAYPGDIDGTFWNKEEMRRNLQPVIEFQKKYGVHIYVGEFSAIRWSPGAAQYIGDLIELCEEYGWDWTYHAFREFHGWSVEHGPDIADTAPSPTPTDREKVVRAWFDKNQKPAWSGTASRRRMPPAYGRILFLGNSITRSAPQVARLGWSGNWGMAASAEGKDYVHLVLARLAEAQGGVMPEHLVAGGRGGKLSDKVAIQQQLTDFKADLAIVQLGENDAENVTVEGFQKPYGELLQAIRSGNPSATILCMGVWSPPRGNPTKDQFIKAACATHGAVFVDMAAANSEPENKAEAEGRFTHKGVNWHPGDKGMEAYANAIWTALTSQPDQQP